MLLNLRWRRATSLPGQKEGLSNMKTNGHFLLLARAFAALLILTSLPLKSAPWVNTGALNVGRNSHTTTLLLNGQLLVAGGVANNGRTTNSAELYNPATSAATS